MKPSQIWKNHWDEWTIGSAVDPELTALNVASLRDQTPYECLLYNWESDKVHPDAIWREINRRFGDNWLHGGWWCSGVDVLTGEDSLWGCFKPDKPRVDKSLGFNPNKPKLIKYEHPIKSATEIFALRVPLHIWQKIATRYGISMPQEIVITSEGEALGFWAWVIAHPEIPVVITEGAKKAGALLTAGYVAIALPGIWSGVRQPKDEFGRKTGRSFLIPQLQAFAQRTREIYLAFDQDIKQKTLQSVNKAIATTAKLFDRQGCLVKVVTWYPGLGKGADDLIAAGGVEAFDKAYCTALPSEVWGVVQLARLTYPVDLEVNSRYLGNFAPPPGYQLICLKAPKGTGKTEWLASQIEPLISQGGKVLLLTHRIQLGEALCNRFGIDYITELRESSTGGLWGYGLCVDSLHPHSQARFNPADWEGAWIVIDEAEQVIWHLLNSSTCQSERVAILRCLKEVIQVALSTNGKIFLSDADISDISIDYIRSLAGFDLLPWIVVNNWRPEKGWVVTNYDGSNPSQLVADLVKRIEQGDKPFICVSGQRKKSCWGTQIIETLLKNRFPSKQILRIDRESIADPEHPAYGCMAHLNELLPQYDIAIASPTIETGVSIDCDHFTSVWGIFQGVQTTDSVRQALARVRANVPRFIWVKTTGISRVGNGSTSIKSLLASQHGMTKANINLLAIAGFTDDIDLNFQPESLTTWAKKAALVNLGMASYRITILEALALEGHIIREATDVDEAVAELVKTEVKVTKEVEYQAHCNAVAEAESVEQQKFEQIKDKRAKTSTERLQYEKGELERRYHVPVTPELVGKDASGWHPQLRLHYYLTVGRQHLPAREASSARKQLEEGDGAIFKPDFNRRQLGAKIWLLDIIGFAKLLQQREYTKNDPELRLIADFCKQHAFEIKAVLGLTIKPNDSPIAIAQKLLGLIGKRLPYLRREGTGDNRVRVYGAAAADFIRDDEDNIIKDDRGQAIPLSDGREQVFAVWLERDAAAITAAALSVEQKDGGFAFGDEIVSDFDTTSRGNKDLDLIEGGRQGVDARGVDVVSADTISRQPEQSELEILIDALARVTSHKEFWGMTRGYSAEMIEDAILFQKLDIRYLLRAWYEAGVDVTEDTAVSLPLPQKPSIEVADLTKEQVDGSQSKGLQETIKVYGQMLVEAFEHGVEAVKALLLPWKSEERWGAILLFEQLAPEKMERLVAIAPSWYEWCET